MFNKRFKNFERGLEVTSAIIFAIGVVISGLLIYILSINTSILWTEGTLDKELTGIVGDFFGGVVGTLFALVSVFLFYLAFQHQKKELHNTNKAFVKQQFENTFFNLLKSQNDIRDKVYTIGKKEIEINYDINQSDWKIIDTKLESFDFFDLIKNKMINQVKFLEKNIQNDLSDKGKENFYNFFNCEQSDLINQPYLKCQVVYNRVYNKYKHQLNHYFRNLYHILKFIKSAEDRELENASNDTDKELVKKDYKKYANFVQAQLSEVEMFLIFYDALFFRRFKKLVQYYKIVENLYTNDLLYPKYDILYYKGYTSTIDKKEYIEGLNFKNSTDELKIRTINNLENG